MQRNFEKRNLKSCNGSLCFFLNLVQFCNNSFIGNYNAIILKKKVFGGFFMQFNATLWISLQLNAILLKKITVFQFFVKFSL